MRFIDLFAGIGGFHYGLDKLNGAKDGGSKETPANGRGKGHPQSQEAHTKGRWVGKHDNGSGAGQEPFTCVYSNEWDKYANSVYRKHFKACDATDIRKVPAHAIPDHDLLCGGFPCQSFSIAGKRGGFADTRGTLFFEIARIVREKRPRLLLLENVKGLLSHDSGRTFGVILATLDEIGYDFQWQVLNSKDFGVPQNRERIFIIGHLRGTPRPKVFPITDYEQEDIGKRKPVFSAIRATYPNNWNGDYVDTDTKYRQEEKKFEGKIRRLTPAECERLQGFPDNWTQYGADGELISDTQRYKMCGNAVTTNVITEIAKWLV